MSEPSKPPFRADHVGSLIRTPDLLAAREKRAKGQIDPADFRRIQQDAIRQVVKLQEDAGLRSITDGEYNRGSWHTDFLKAFANVEDAPSRFATTFHTDTGDMERRPHMLAVTGKFERKTPIFVQDFAFLRSVTDRTPKITIPSPSVMHFRGGREAVSREAYPDMEGFFEDLTAAYRAEIADLYAAGCRYLQIDEVNLAYLCDPGLRERARETTGEDPDALGQLYARLINAAIRDRPADMTVCMHLCRGNFAGAWVAEGGYEPLADLLFNQIDVDGYFMEYDTARAGGFQPLRHLPEGKRVVLGLVSTKSPDLESKEGLKRRIEDAARFTPLDRLCLSPQCGFESGLGGMMMSTDQERAKLALVVETAREVWA